MRFREKKIIQNQEHVTLETECILGVATPIAGCCGIITSTAQPNKK